MNSQTNHPRRRDFLAALAAVLPASALNAVQQKGNDLLACNSWPFRAYFDTPQMHEYRNPEYPLLTQADFPQFLADHFNIHNVEFLPEHFADTTDATIEKVKSALKRARSRCCNLMGVGMPGDVYTKLDRTAVVEVAERWARVAVSLGSPSITVPLNGKAKPNPEIAAENLRPLVAVAQQRGLKVLFHNDDIRTEAAEILVAVIKHLGSDQTGTCPDFGNFAPKSSAYAFSQLQLLAPYASNICHAKDGLAENGNFYEDNFAASMKLMRGTGFKGVYSLEFEGLGKPIEGVKKLQELTLQFLA